MPIEIDAGSNLYLADDGDGDRDTFARVFREVWHTIPVEYRESMVREWKKGLRAKRLPLQSTSCPVIGMPGRM